jgi:hypothetical protein
MGSRLSTRPADLVLCGWSIDRGVCGECGIRIWHIAEEALATFRRFLDGPCACLVSCFARKDGASRLIDIPKRTPTRFIPPLVLFTRVFLGVVSAKGSQQYPQATPTKTMPGIQH